MAGEVYARKVAGSSESINEAVEGFFEALPTAARLHAGSRVLLKPNLLAKHAPDAAVTTHPDVVRAVVLALHRRGVTDITLADSPGGPYTPGAMQGIYKATGLAAVCDELGVTLYTACETGEIAFDPPRTDAIVQRFELLRPVLDCDFIINLPKMKTHVMTCMSGAVKNLFGCVPGLQKAEFHMRFPNKEDFGHMLVVICRMVNADLHIVDGLLAMEGDGPSGGNARRENLLFASENPYNLDLALCHVMGLEPANAPMLAAAMKLGLCSERFDAALWRGDAAAQAVLPGFQPPRSFEQDMNFLTSVPRFLQPLFGPISRRIAPRPAVNRPKCIGCGKCAEICPKQVIVITEKKAVIDYSGCIRCFCCHEMCPVKAMDVKRFGLFGRL